MDSFNDIGIIKNQPKFDQDKLDAFLFGIENLRSEGNWKKEDILRLYLNILPEFDHKETGKYLDQKM